SLQRRRLAENALPGCAALHVDVDVPRHGRRRAGGRARQATRHHGGVAENADRDLVGLEARLRVRLREDLEKLRALDRTAVAYDPAEVLRVDLLQRRDVALPYRIPPPRLDLEEHFLLRRASLRVK